jgi:multisubunit Na+/H+ antiporter MnhB subunit
MRVFQGLALVVMAAFFVWLLLAMSRTPESDRRLAAMALAFAGVFFAFGLGAVLGRWQDRD